MTCKPGAHYIDSNTGEPFIETTAFPDPTPEMLERDDFEAVWQVVKRWDINVAGAYFGYMGGIGNHVRMILDALDQLKQRQAYLEIIKLNKRKLQCMLENDKK